VSYFDRDIYDGCNVVAFQALMVIPLQLLPATLDQELGWLLVLVLQHLW